MRDRPDSVALERLGKATPLKVRYLSLRGSGAQSRMGLEELLAGQPISTPVTNPLGCNVKWDGQDAHWMPPEACDLV